jgi:murein L,D-transpeptidase YafK
MPMPSTVLAGRISAFALLASVTVLLAGCGEDPGHLSDRAYQPLSPQILALMQDKGTTPSAPMLIRAYKKEAEFEIWKMKADGHYALLKTYPMCRWSGQLGPKEREGDRQVPEGFYAITPGQMNPNSNYYLSFNVGYPNAYDRAHGRTGQSIMVHGACSSAGCFSMTDQQIAEIYAIAREAFAGGQNAIQMQSLPFHMTAENLAKYRLDPNIAFWKELRTGADNFEVTGQEVAVGVCEGRYVFNAEAANGSQLEPTGACPPLKHDPMVLAEVVAKQKRDDAKVTELIAEGVEPVRTIYADGGQNPSFASVTTDVSRPEAIAQGPVDVAVDDNRRTPTPAQLRAAEAKDLAEADAADKKAAELRTAREAADQPDPMQTAAIAQPQPANPAPANPQQDPSGGSIFTRLFRPAPQPQPAAQEAAAQPPQVQTTAAQQPATPAAANPEPDGSGGSILTRLFNPHPAAPAPAPAPTQTAAEQPVSQQQTAGPASDGGDTGFNRLYSASQPARPQPPAAQTAAESPADSDESAQPADVPLPPLRKRARAQKPVVTRDAAAKAAPSQPDAAPAQAPNAPTQQAQTSNPPAQPAQTSNSAPNAFGDLTPIVPEGFSTTAAADH